LEYFIRMMKVWPEAKRQTKRRSKQQDGNKGTQLLICQRRMVGAGGLGGSAQQVHSWQPYVFSERSIVAPQLMVAKS